MSAKSEAYGIISQASSFHDQSFRKIFREIGDVLYRLAKELDNAEKKVSSLEREVSALKRELSNL